MSDKNDKHQEEYWRSVWKGMTSGDVRAFEILYNEYYLSMLSYGLRFCNQEEIVKDSIHDVFLKIFQNKSLKEPASIHAYLLKSLKNTLLDLMRTSMFWDTVGDFSVEIEIEDPAFQSLFAHNDAARDLSLRLQDALKSLSDNQKQIIYLRFVKQLNYEEVSTVLGINKQSAMNLAFRALSKLKKNLTS